ncbi:MAG TPA: hypothetical protein VLT56_13790 [Desulfobacterales bacterium]|nr:hypothetical protein [Desulfobacterales bacterium]
MIFKNRAWGHDPALCGFSKCVVCPKIEGWEAGKLEGKPFCLIVFHPPSLKPIVALADGLMLVFQHPVNDLKTVKGAGRAPVSV